MSPGPCIRVARRWLGLGVLGGLLASASLWAAAAAPRAADTVISPQANGPVAAVVTMAQVLITCPSSPLQSCQIPAHASMDAPDAADIQ